jgi:membrane protease YdiL (CAAX protease family)
MKDPSCCHQNRQPTDDVRDVAIKFSGIRKKKKKTLQQQQPLSFCSYNFSSSDNTMTVSSIFNARAINSSSRHDCSRYYHRRQVGGVQRMVAPRSTRITAASFLVVLLLFFCVSVVSAFHHHVSPAFSTRNQRPPSLLSVSSSLTSSSTPASSSSRLYYRNRQEHEERLTSTATTSTTTTTSLPSPSTTVTSSSRTRRHEGEQEAEKAELNGSHYDHVGISSDGGINLAMIAHLAKSQLQVLAVASVVTIVLVLWQSGGLVGDFSALLNGLNWAPLPLGHLADTTSTSTYTSFLAQSLLQGIATAIPMIYLGDQMVESSSLRDLSRVNFATTNMVVTLFGRRRRQPRQHHQHQSDQRTGMRLSSTMTAFTEDSHSLLSHHPTRILSVDEGAIVDNEQIRHEGSRTLDVVLYSLLLATTTAICEEVVFRGYSPAVMMHALTGTTTTASLTGAAAGNMPLVLVAAATIVTLLGQSVLFGLAHVHPHSRFSENVVVAAMQSGSGIIYGLAYILTGGNIVVPIVAHALYDTHVLCETWHQVNCQMDYTERKCSSPLSTLSSTSTSSLLSISSSSADTKHDDDDCAAVREIQKQAGAALSDETLMFLRRFFYAFDSTHVGTLSLDDVQRAVTYAFLHDDDELQQRHGAAAVPTQQQVHQMFLTVLAQRQQQASSMTIRASEEVERLRFSEFLRLLFSLRAQAHHHHHHATTSTR